MTKMTMSENVPATGEQDRQGSARGTSACCAVEAQEVCCEPSEKASCCGSAHGTGCGCQGNAR
jgi:hypothetical protein